MLLSALYVVDSLSGLGGKDLTFLAPLSGYQRRKKLKSAARTHLSAAAHKNSVVCSDGEKAKKLEIQEESPGKSL